jgi:hypothetical protein
MTAHMFRLTSDSIPTIPPEVILPLDLQAASITSQS